MFVFHLRSTTFYCPSPCLIFRFLENDYLSTKYLLCPTRSTPNIIVETPNSFSDQFCGKTVNFPVQHNTAG